MVKLNVNFNNLFSLLTSKPHSIITKLTPLGKKLETAIYVITKSWKSD